jgi:hypothetical protein
MSGKDFKAKVESKEFGLKWETGRNIAKMAGVLTAEQDFSPALPYLPYFAEAIANGLDFETSRAILLESPDLSTATVNMRKQFPQEAML